MFSPLEQFNTIMLYDAVFAKNIHDPFHYAAFGNILDLTFFHLIIPLIVIRFGFVFYLLIYFFF